MMPQSSSCPHLAQNTSGTRCRLHAAADCRGSFEMAGYELALLGIGSRSRQGPLTAPANRWSAGVIPRHASPAGGAAISKRTVTPLVPGAHFPPNTPPTRPQFTPNLAPIYPCHCAPSAPGSSSLPPSGELRQCPGRTDGLCGRLWLHRGGSCRPN